MSKSIRKIVNDPVHGFISISDPLISSLTAHRYFQRLRHISQMGMSFMVYPGAVHNRFAHTLGCYFLMKEAIETLQSKGHFISEEETLAAQMAILMHDMGHGPLSHVLEKQIVPIDHEDISLLFMERLNANFDGRLSCAIELFKNTYSKTFLHQLISSQLDVDRLDYLTRDSFYTGVMEGKIGTERIIKMFDLHKDSLVMEEKALYSVEKFIVSRRLMYWQVYLHKTSVAAELILVSLMKRARKLAEEGKEIFFTPMLRVFMENRFEFQDFQNQTQLLDQFAMLDDHDIWTCIKAWCLSSDKILSYLSRSLYQRNLWRAEMMNDDFPDSYVETIKQNLMQREGFTEEELAYLVIRKELSSKTYKPKEGGIDIKLKSGLITDICEVSNLVDEHFLSKNDNKYLLCYPK